MTQVDTSNFKPLTFEFGKIHMSGGHSTKSHPMISKTITAPGGETVTFVKLAVTEMWLIASTTGHCRYAGSSFGRTSLLDVLREEIQTHCDNPGSVPDPDPAEGDDYDPMIEVEGDKENTPNAGKTKGRGLKRIRYYRNHVAKTIVSLDMPVRCPEEDPTGTERRKIRIYIEDRRQIWLDLADVEWAVRYLYTQNHLKGVPLIADDSTGPGDANLIHGHEDDKSDDTVTCGDMK